MHIGKENRDERMSSKTMSVAECTSVGIIIYERKRVKKGLGGFPLETFGKG